MKNNKKLFMLTIMASAISFSLTIQAAQCPEPKDIIEICDQGDSCSYSATEGWSGKNRKINGQPEIFKYVVVREENGKARIDYCTYVTDKSLNNNLFNQNNSENIKDIKEELIKILQQTFLKKEKSELKTLEKSTYDVKIKALQLLNKLNVIIASHSEKLDSFSRLIMNINERIEKLEANSINEETIIKMINTINSIPEKIRSVPDFRLFNRSNIKTIWKEKIHGSIKQSMCNEGISECQFTWDKNNSSLDGISTLDSDKSSN